MEDTAKDGKGKNGRKTSCPLFLQVYRYVQERIERGEWCRDMRLPSVRSLADQLDVHRLTVFKAYRKMAEDGILYVRDKAGYYVAAPGQAAPADLGESFSEDTPGTYALPTNALWDIQNVPVKYQFSQALIDPNLLPNLFLSDYVKKVFDLYPKVMGTYANVQGDSELRETLSAYYQRSQRLQLGAEELLITSGAQQAINLVADVMLRPFDTVLVERPTYSAAMEIFRRAGARLLPVDITPEGYDLDELEELMRRHKPRLFYLNPTHHNPTGYTIPVPQRKRLVELAERHRCLLVEDDPFRDMYFGKEPPPPLFSYDTEGWVVYIGSFSKYVAPGLRICAVAARYPFMKRLLTAKSLADNGTPLLNQKIFLHYFCSDRLRQHLGKLRTALQVHKEIAEQGLRAAGWEWISPQGGLNLWVKLPEHVPAGALFQACMEESIAFVPGEVLDPLGEMKGRIRLSYSFSNELLLADGVRRLTEIAKAVSE